MKNILCTSCGYQGNGKKLTRGLFAVEILLWICFLIPGLAYTMWRVSTRYYGCPQCESTTVIPPDSPVAIQFLANINKDSTPPKREEKQKNTPIEDYDDQPNIYVIK